MNKYTVAESHPGSILVFREVISDLPPSEMFRTLVATGRLSQLSFRRGLVSLCPSGVYCFQCQEGEFFGDVETTAKTIEEVLG